VGKDILGEVEIEKKSCLIVFRTLRLHIVFDTGTHFIS